MSGLQKVFSKLGGHESTPSWNCLIDSLMIKKKLATIDLAINESISQFQLGVDSWPPNFENTFRRPRHEEELSLISVDG